jgi:hypothetical protein
MFSNYFIYNGKKYYTGTVVVLKNGSNNVGSFVCHNLDSDLYTFNMSGHRYHFRKNDFERCVVSITEKIDTTVRIPVQKTMKDSYISGMSLGWVWYIFLMAISTLFKGNICFWIMISILFFAWRRKKIKEEGTYYEW